MTNEETYEKILSRARNCKMSSKYCPKFNRHFESRYEHQEFHWRMGHTY